MTTDERVMNKSKEYDMYQKGESPTARACFRRKPYGDNPMTELIQDIDYEEIARADMERIHGTEN